MREVSNMCINKRMPYHCTMQRFPRVNTVKIMILVRDIDRILSSLASNGIKRKFLLGLVVCHQRHSFRPKNSTSSSASWQRMGTQLQGRRNRRNHFCAPLPHCDHTHSRYESWRIGWLIAEDPHKTAPREVSTSAQQRGQEASILKPSKTRNPSFEMMDNAIQGQSESW